MNYAQDAVERLTKKLPKLDRDLIKLYALLVISKGNKTSLEDVHNAWAIWQNEKEPNHRSLIPFHLLDDNIQELDRPYRDIIWQVWVDIQAANC